MPPKSSMASKRNLENDWKLSPIEILVKPKIEALDLINKLLPTLLNLREIFLLKTLLINLDQPFTNRGEYAIDNIVANKFNNFLKLMCMEIINLARYFSVYMDYLRKYFIYELMRLGLLI